MPTGLLPLLFDREVTTCEVSLSSPLGELYPEEALALRSALPRRLLEFRAGRHCARLALERLGIAAGPLLPSEDRLPLWPAGVVGSISHTGSIENGWCGAAVASSERVASLGLDAELALPLEPALWSRVLRNEEADLILATAPAERGLIAKLFFCAKEAAYKCQFPLTRQFLEFQDVSVRLNQRDQSFHAVLERAALPFAAGTRFSERFVRTPKLFATAVLLDADDPTLTTRPDCAR